ncbi:hypothetical protein ACNKHO_10230 [Shigella flexneri]
MNEVLANRATSCWAASAACRRYVHPNDNINKSQSSNDVFPTRDASGGGDCGA